MRLKLAISDGVQVLPGQITEHDFNEAGGLIGRGDDCCWILNCSNKLISRRHARVTFEGGGFYLYDASLNGIRVNASRTPLGLGNKVVINGGDVFHMGDFTIVATLQGGPEAAHSVANRHADTEQNPESAVVSPDQSSTAGSHVPASGQSQTRSVRPVDLGTTGDAFPATASVIPDDWDFVPNLLDRDPGNVVAPSLSRQLDLLQPSLPVALRTGLSLDVTLHEGQDMTPEAAEALARSARLCLQAVIALRSEFRLLEQRFIREAPSQDGAAPPESLQHESADAFFQALIEETNADAREQLIAGLSNDLQQLQGAHSGMVAELWAAYVNVISEFSPSRMQDRLYKGIAAKGWRGWFHLFRFRLMPAAVSWNYYQAWYKKQRNPAHNAFRVLFVSAIKCFTLCRRRQPRRQQPALANERSLKERRAGAS